MKEMDTLSVAHRSGRKRHSRSSVERSHAPQLSCRARSRNMQQSVRLSSRNQKRHTSRNCDCQPYDTNSEADGSIAKRTRQSSKNNQIQFSSAAVSYDQQQAGGIDPRSPAHFIESEDHCTPVPAKRTRLSSTVTHQAVRKQRQRSSADGSLKIVPFTASADEPMNMMPRIAVRMPGSVGKRRSAVLEASATHHRVS